MSTHTGVIYAAIDLGSNSAKITVATVGELISKVDDTIEIVANKSTMIRLGESVNTTGEITPEKQDAVIATLQKYQQLAQNYQTSSTIVVATEAVRKAQNCAAFLNAVQQETGLTIHVLSGEIEAALTYLGATSDHQGVSDVGVVDIGGGSTELIIAQQGHIQWLVSLPIGSGWLHDHYLSSDPPSVAETDKTRTFLDTYLRQLQLSQMPATLIATGSSAQILLKLAKQALQIAKEGHTLNRNDLLGCLGLLSALPAEEIARRYKQPLERARVLPGGAHILLALMNCLQIEEITVSQRGVSEGALLATQRYGENWIEHPDVKVDTSHIGQAPDPSDLDQSNKLPTDKDHQPPVGEDHQIPVDEDHQIPTDQDHQIPTDKGRQPSTHKTRRGRALRQPTFAETGRQELQKRSKTFVKWITPVLKNEEVEAVHQMRVASRRLRATLDAYQSACAQKPFKRIYQEVKQTADLLGTARDTDVMLLHLEQLQQQLPDNEKPGIQWLITRLQSYRQQQQQEIIEFFDYFGIRRFKRVVASCMPEGVPTHGKS